MLAWLVLIIVGLSGLFFAAESNGLSGSASSGVIAGLGAVGALAFVYVLTFSTPASDEQPWWRRLATAAAAVALSAACLPLLRSQGFLDLAVFRQAAVATSDASTAPTGPVAVRLRRSADGRFATRALINDVAIDVVVDTGATNVMLRASDAEAAGLETATLAYDTAISTANGTAYVATARLRSVQVGLLQIADVEVLVAKPGSLNESLLGSSFLRRLSSYDLTGEFITLRN